MAATIRAMPCALNLTSDQPVLDRGAGNPAGTDAGVVLGQYPEGHGGPRDWRAKPAGTSHRGSTAQSPDHEAPTAEPLAPTPV